MQYKVFYFTRTNTCKRIAEMLAEKLSCEVVRITDNKNWNGPIGWLKAGFYSSMERKVKIQVPGGIDNVEEYIVVTPIWASKIVPAIREFLKLIPSESTHLVVSSLETRVEDGTAFKSITHIRQKVDNETPIIDTLVQSLL